MERAAKYHVSKFTLEVLGLAISRTMVRTRCSGLNYLLTPDGLPHSEDEDFEAKLAYVDLTATYSGRSQRRANVSG